MVEEVKNPYTHLFVEYGKYFSDYGGVKALLSSPYVHISLFLSIIAFATQSTAHWATQAVETIPNLLGFTLGGYAIFVSFGDDEFKKAISGSVDGEKSPLNEFNTTFMHFIVAQASCLLISHVNYFTSDKSILYNIEHSFGFNIWEFLFSVSFFIGNVLGWFSSFSFFYAISLVFASAIAIYRLVSAYDASNDR